MNIKLKLQIFVYSALVAVSSMAAGQEAFVRNLIAKNQRPSLAEIEALLSQGYLPDFINKSDLPIDDHRPSPGTLQNNYPVWFNHLRTNAADFIIELERAYPGALFAFIGRDMETIADLTEAFYRNLGQTDRVARIAMSRGTLENLDNQTAIDYLAQYQIQFVPGKPLRKVVFIDTISRGSGRAGSGGRQGRFLLNALSQHYVNSGGNPLDLVKTLGFVGLLGATANIRENPIQNSGHIFANLENIYKQLSGNGSFTYGEHFPVMTFQDSRTSDYQGFNESGYEHWVGAWHGPYGPLQRINNQLVAVPTQVHDDLRKQAVLNFQLHVVNFARSQELFDEVHTKSTAMKFDFPGLKVWNPARDTLRAKIHSASRYEDIPTLIEQAQSENSGFVIPLSEVKDFWISNIRRLDLPIDRSAWNLINTHVDLKDSQIQAAIAPILFHSRKTDETSMLIDFLNFGGRFSTTDAKTLALDQFTAGRFGLGRNILSSHNVGVAEPDVTSLVQNATSFSNAIKILDRLCEVVGHDNCQSTVLTSANIFAVMKFSAKIDEYEKFFADTAIKLGSRSSLLLDLLTRDLPIPFIDRARQVFSMAPHSANLILFVGVASAKVLSDTEIIELLELVLTNSLTAKTANLRLLEETSIRTVLFNHRNILLEEGQNYPSIRSIYWSLFVSPDRSGRAHHMFHTEVDHGESFFRSFRDTREALVKKGAGSSEVNYFDDLGGERLIRDPVARTALDSESWAYLLSNTTIGTPRWIERFARFLGPADQFVKHFKAMQNRIAMTNELFETFLSFMPTIDQLIGLRQAVAHGWQHDHIKWFADQYFLANPGEDSVLNLLNSLHTLEARPGTIHEIAQLPDVLGSIRTVRGINLWLSYFADDEHAFRTAYSQALDWIQVPSEFNALIRPSKHVRTRDFIVRIRKWRAEKKRAGWKFHLFQSISPFGQAVDTGARRVETCESHLNVITGAGN